MPRYTDSMNSFSPPFFNGIIFVLSERNETFVKLTNLHNPVNHISKPLSFTSFFCGLPDSTHPKDIDGVRQYLLFLYYGFFSNFSDNTFFGYSVLFSKNKGWITNFPINFNKKFDSNGLLAKFHEINEEHVTSKVLAKNRATSTSTLVLTQQIFFILIGKSEHKGMLGIEIEIIIKSSVFRFLSRLTYRILIKIPKWIYTQTWVSEYFQCGWQGFVTPRYSIARHYFHQVFRLKSIPCLHCPTNSECTSQGAINPFDCVYITSWEQQKIK